MAEYIERESAYEDFEKCNSENQKWTPSRVKTLLARQKAADVAPVIRCHECKQGEVDDPDFPDEYYCHAGCGWNNGDFYCSYGEKRCDKDGTT